ncbi:SDR family NAD(P)-dependent oxidoreductase [Mesorhizobium sp. SARCC-RB16n]|uniref:SDR family NAD(P)-dependent oxidoreductase n=1 Tax=Mesorhizobium sp. SARCC-RB16n TaxID=2116687 RepID=UPI002484A038|nr:SDR family NAD(P)-dependent oxidoreductase [Mesorhizobium sp. SARCC-RB16n]
MNLARLAHGFRLPIFAVTPDNEGDCPMSTNVLNTPSGTVLIVGASRGLGHAMAAEFLRKGWNVVGTIRKGSGRTKLHDLTDEFEGRLEIETVDICEPDQVAALRDRLSGRVFDICSSMPALATTRLKRSPM